jgi:hypothetical protein
MPEDLVMVGQFQFLPEAQAARMHLQGLGIQSFLSDAELINMDWLLGNAVGYIKLQVSSSQAEAALDALEKIDDQRARREDAQGDVVGAADCLECGAKLLRGQSTCAACGWSYSGEEGEAVKDEPPTGEAEGESEEAQTTSGMDTLRSIKKPLFLLMLTPLFVGIAVLALLALGFLVWIAKILFVP